VLTECGQQVLIINYCMFSLYHCHRRGEGFCVFSDIAVAANIALRDYPSLVKRILIIDLDVHQGNFFSLFTSFLPLSSSVSCRVSTVNNAF
jgi:Histone deacetylase domain